jgi:hypothetical protein
VFGHALKAVSCVLKRQECFECPLREKCLYTRVFETQLAMDVPEGLHVTAPPHPFVVEPPDIDRREFESDERFDCNLLLFGEVNQSLPYFIYAFDRIGRIGIGKKIDGRRTGFALETVSANGRQIYDADEGKIHNVDVTSALAVPFPPSSNGGMQRLDITLKTPLRFKYRNRIGADLPFHVLMRAVLRRISSLFACYAGGEPPLDYGGLLKRAEDVRVADNALRWYGWHRYSNRQKQHMPLGGMVGRITYEGRLAEFLPLLNLAGRLHIGKQTAFGLGSIAISGPTALNEPTFK